eukprot:3863861-Pyramimonas_sp.AAC.1
MLGVRLNGTVNGEHRSHQPIPHALAAHEFRTATGAAPCGFLGHPSHRSLNGGGWLPARWKTMGNN